MPGIFDVLAANGILNSLFGSTPAPTPSPYQQRISPISAQLTSSGRDEMLKEAERQGILANPSIQALPVTPNTPPASTGILPVTPNTPPAVMTPMDEPVATPPAPIRNAYGTTQTPGEFGNPLETLKSNISGLGDSDKWIRAADLLGKGLMSAGSPDPAKTLAMFQQQDAETNKTKVTPLADGAFSMIQEPGKPHRIVRNDEVAKYLGDAQQERFQQALQKVILGGQVQANTAAAKEAIKTGEETRPLLNDVNGMISRWQQAQDIIKGQGTWSQVQAIPGIQGLAGFFGGDEVAKNKFLEGLTVDETLLNTARTKGAISNQEMNLFKQPIPSTTDDREKVWKPWIEKRIEVLGKLKSFYEGEVARGSAAGGQPSSQPAPSPSTGGPVTVSSEAEWANLPSGTQYRGPDGKLRTKR